MKEQIRELFNTDIKTSDISRASGVSKQLIGRYRKEYAGIDSMTLEKADMISSVIRYKVTDEKCFEVIFRERRKAEEFMELLFQSEQEGLYKLEITLK